MKKICRANKRSEQPEQDTAATDSSKDFRVVSVLSLGKANAVSSQYLADILGFKSIRELQKEIEHERRNGAVILSTCESGGGYYRPGCTQEVQQFIKTLENRSMNTLKALRSARTYLRQQGGTDGEWVD